MRSRAARQRNRRADAKLLLVALAGLAACGEVSAFDLQLVPDPEWTDAPQLLALARRIRVVVDSPQGLYPASAARRLGRLVLADLDADGAVELSTELEMDGLDHLPLLRLERGGLPDVPIDVRFEGLGGEPEDVVAGGSARGLSFTAQAVVAQDVLFKPRLRLLPPRVTQVIPADGAVEELVGSLFIVFPKQMDAESLRAAGTLSLVAVAGRDEQPVPAREIRVQFLPGAESPTTVEYRLASLLAPGRYRVRVAEQARDLDGRALDQVPAQPGNQPFTSQFEVSDARVETATAACPLAGPCATAPCGSDGGGAICSAELSCEDGACAPQRCPASCARGTLCDASSSLCVVDCRDFGAAVCPAERPRCGDDGACHAAR